MLVKDFKIVSVNAPVKYVEREVNDLLDKGYQLKGKLRIMGGRYVQVMVKYE